VAGRYRLGAGRLGALLFGLILWLGLASPAPAAPLSWSAAQLLHSPAPAQEQACVAAGTALPTIVRADVSHPGDRKKQLIYADVAFEPMPAECVGLFRRVDFVRFQLQDPLNHQRWFNVGPFRRFFFEDDDHPESGRTTAYYFENEEITNRRYIYRCTPGSGKTKARALFRQEVKSLTGQTVGQAAVVRPLRIKHVPFKLDAEQKRRGAVQGAC
jgi:hypothetical protein